MISPETTGGVERARVPRDVPDPRKVSVTASAVAPALRLEARRGEVLLWTPAVAGMVAVGHVAPPRVRDA